jgi:hypothetical protein
VLGRIGSVSHRRLACVCCCHGEIPLECGSDRDGCRGDLQRVFRRGIEGLVDRGGVELHCGRVENLIGNRRIGNWKLEI